MGIQVVSPKLVRKASQATGLDFDRVVVCSNWTWEGRVIHPDGTHTHHLIDKLTWATELLEDVHWTSCREQGLA